MKIFIELTLFILFAYIYFNLKSILVRIGLVKLSKYERSINSAIIIIFIICYMLLSSRK